MKISTTTMMKRKATILAVKLKRDVTSRAECDSRSVAKNKNEPSIVPARQKYAISSIYPLFNSAALPTHIRGM